MLLLLGEVHPFARKSLGSLEIILPQRQADRLVPHNAEVHIAGYEGSALDLVRGPS